MALKDMFLTISEAAKLLDVSRQTIYRWIKDKKFPAEKIGGVILVDKKSVLEYDAKVMDDSILDRVRDSLEIFIRRQFKYSAKDEIEQMDEEDDCLVFLVNKKRDGKSDKIKVGGLEVTFSIGRKEGKQGIRSVKFEDTIVTEFEQSQNKKQGGKKSK